ncbi:putative soyasaponin III rhamnosyltransferase-like [Sesbania bispinosa]|nr:putative soyasaponin III rhamnosyltransferase-like [Sesbania bispinosa]
MGSTGPISPNANGEVDKPLHVVMLPWLAMGHIYPYFEVAKILAQKGHSVTFINNPKNIDRMPKNPKSQPFIKLERLPLPHIEHLPEGVESTMDIPANKGCYLKFAYEGLKDVVAEILETSKPDHQWYRAVREDNCFQIPLCSVSPHICGYLLEGKMIPIYTI